MYILARALLKDAPILLLAEATASLDPENELYIQQAIQELVPIKRLLSLPTNCKRSNDQKCRSDSCAE
jgi:ABC-type multidrug transport system fused ATPase/permease subunit